MSCFPPSELRRSTLPIALLVALVAAGCATSGVNEGDLNLLSYEEEWELGQRLERDLASRLELVRDQRVVGYVSRLGEDLVEQTELAAAGWEFHLVDDPAVNAFNVPGGHVYVNTGLVVAAGDVSQLAGVLAHEIAHGVARHATEQLTARYGFGVLAGLALGEQPGRYEELLAQILGGGALASFSRDDEREADRLGVRYLYDAGYDPRGMAAMFETLLEERRRRPNAVERFFSTHPLTEERIRAVRELAAALPPKRGLITRDPAFQQVQKRVSR